MRRRIFFTETVEILLKNRPFSARNFGFFLRIGHFAQVLVKFQAAAGKVFFAVDNKKIMDVGHRPAGALVKRR